MKKLKIWGISPEDTGVGFYRINQPLRFIGHQNLAKVHTMPFFGQHVRHLYDQEFREYFELEGKWADVLITTCPADRLSLSFLLALRDLYKLKLIIDLDDDRLFVHTEPNNPAYSAYMNEGNELLKYQQYAITQADMITVSTDYLKKRLDPLNKNVVVIKNCIDTSLFTKSKNKETVIGYAGSGSHQGDWMMIEKILEKLRKKYDFKVKLLGPMQASIKIDEQINWVDCLKYPKALSDLNLTIGLAPLKDSLMNRAKSNLRWLEYSALGIPTVASDVVPFRGISNILYANEPEEWESQLEKLIIDHNLGTKIGNNAYNELRKHYDPRTESRKLFDAISGIGSASSKK
jgi:glycosyltransferase involved in cell wall biosynthesis